MGINGMGSEFRRWNSSTGSWEAIASINNISGPDASREMIDDTALDSANNRREFIAGLIDEGSVSLDLVFARDTYETMRTDFEDSTAQNYEIVLPDSDTTTLEFEGYVAECPLDGTPRDDRIMCSISIKVTGAVSLESGSGPSPG